MLRNSRLVHWHTKKRAKSHHSGYIKQNKGEHDQVKEICAHTKCSGCGLCVARCPKQCIHMEEGLLGHLYPVIDESTCINCGLCEKSCPSLHPIELRYPMGCFAAWSKDEEDYRSSTSGGAASVLSHHVIEQGGAVYGCAMGREVDVRHIRVDKKEGLSQLKGSKYVQSTIIDVLPQIKKDVAEGKPTLFIGTPCQCAAVRALYKEKPDNLLLVDIVCHGVPSLSFLKEHVRHKAKGKKADSVLFRNGSTYEMSILSDSHVIYRQSLYEHRYEDIYYNTFIDGFSSRESCHECPYARPYRGTDLTIGDFWGLGDKIPANEIPEHPYGCSVILVHSEVGRLTLQAIEEKIHLYPRSIEEAVSGNSQLRAPMPLGKRGRVWVKIQSLIHWPQAYRLLMMDKIVIRQMRKLIRKIK